MIYCAVFCEKFNDVDIYIEFIKEIELFEEKSKIRFKIFEFFPNFLIHINTCESNFLLHNMIEHNILSPKDVKNCLYFVHYGLGDYKQNEENLLQNNCELHKKYIKAGVNPNEIVKIIRNDDIIELQEISSQTNFDFNQTIEPSLYERCEFINQKHVTLIDYAAFFSAVKCFKYLLMNGANVNKTGKYAIAGGNIEIIHLCEQNHMAFYGLYEAAIKYHKNDIFKYIYENKIEELYDLEKLGILCVLHHNYEIFSFLLGIGMDINENIIVKSAKIGNLFLIKHFLKENLIPKNILFSSIKSGNIELVQYILEQEGIDINSKNRNGATALTLATKKGFAEIAQLLLEQKEININAKDKSGNTPLIIASSFGYINIIKLLLEKEEIDINTKNNSGDTVLICASKTNHSAIVKLLLDQKGININDYNESGNTPLIIASSFGYIEIVKLLLEHEGIDVNAKNKGGYTALICASKNGYTDIVKLLLDQKGININSKNEYGETALIWSSENGNIEIVELLLKQEGIDINSTDCEGNTAFIKAIENGYTEVVTLLQKVNS